MRKIMLYFSIILTTLLILSGCSNQQEKQKKSQVIILPVISLNSTGGAIHPAFYENGFDFKYDDLPTLELIENKDIMKIELLDNFRESIRLGEDYYKSTGHGVFYRKRNI